MHDDRVLKEDRQLMFENKKETRRGKRYLERKLFEYFKCNKTNLNFKIFKPNIKTAIKNEKYFCEELNELKTELGSNVGKLLDSMME